MGNKGEIGLVAPVLGVLLGVALVVIDVGVRMDLRLLDAFQRSASPRTPSSVVIIDIDADTTIDFGWPISPAIYALVIQAAHEAGAEAIGVDILFHDQRLRWLEGGDGSGMEAARATDEEADPEDELLGAIAVATGAVLATYSHRETTETQSARVFPRTPDGSRGVCPNPKRQSMASPLRPGLREARVGHVNVVTIPDGVHRRVVDCSPVHDGCLRSLASVMMDPEGRSASCAEAEIVPYLRAFEEFPRISMSEVTLLMGNEEGEARLRDLMRGRHVLIGPSDQGVGDLGPTPASSWEPLVAVHANRVEAMLEGRRVAEVSRFVPMTTATLLVILFAWLAFPARGWLGVGALAILAGFLASFAAFRLGSAWMPATSFILPMLLGSISAAAWGGWRHLQFNQMLTHAFGSYVSPDVLEWLKETGGAALDPNAAERREISVLFSDIAGYTKLSNKLGADGVMKSLRLYLFSMVNVIQKSGGYLDKINGDGLMVLFGAPRALPGCAVSAVSCANEMLAEVARLQEQWREITGQDLIIRIGIATGPAIVGNLGGEGHVEYTAIAPVVNLAARLESKAPVGGLLFCEKTYQSLTKPPEGEWTEVELKGYESAGPVRVFSVPPPAKDDS